MTNSERKHLKNILLIVIDIYFYLLNFIRYQYLIRYEVL